MAVKLQSTASVAVNGLKALIFGASKAGKTTLLGTLKNQIIFSAEGGLLSLAEKEIPYVEIKTMADLVDAYQWVKESEEARKYQSIGLDSISEIAEVVLSAEKKKSKDGRAAYGEANEIVSDLIRSFRDLPGKDVIFIAKLDKVPDESGRILYGPSMPGKTLTQGVAYYFDLVLALRAEKDPEGKVVRALMCDTDGLWNVGNRGGKLDTWEAPDLSAIIAKVKGGVA